MKEPEPEQETRLRKQLMEGSLGLYKLARVERECTEPKSQSFVDYLCDLELISSWAAGLLLSSNFEKRFEDQTMCGDLIVFLGMLPAISARTIEVSEEFPATASYANSITLQLYYIKSALDRLAKK
jgi:hypothetical protein